MKAVYVLGTVCGVFGLDMITNARRQEHVLGIWLFRVTYEVSSGKHRVAGGCRSSEVLDEGSEITVATIQALVG